MSQLCFALAIATLVVVPASSYGQSSNPCPRFPVGSAVTPPLNLYSHNGVLTVNFTYQTEVASNGLTRYCFITDNGVQSPTLHVNPGDELIVNLTNGLPQTPANMATMPEMTMSGPSCIPGAMMTNASVNVHYHGTNVPPTCHQDEVLTTLVNAGSSYQYKIVFPTDEPPGLYWYHPHIHGISEAAVLGGASGAIIVEGIQNVNPLVAGLPYQVLIIRDNNVPGVPQPDQPAWDVSLNYVPVPYPIYTPAVIHIQPGQQQFWRVLNACADTIIRLEVVYDGVPQTLSVVALDGVPTNSQDGTTKGTPLYDTQIFIPPAGRAEFVVTGPSTSVKTAQLLTLYVNTGPDGDYDPDRPLANILASANASQPDLIPAVSGPPPPARFSDLATTQPTVERQLYFSENNNTQQFFITVQGQTPKVFNVDNPPAIVTTQGSVEDWTIENRATEDHEFHIHQIHFLPLEVNGVPVSGGQYLDTINVPYWSGSGPYPRIKVRMDFRGNVSGDFVYHCHILQHEDAGMMAIIRVLPAPSKAAKAVDRPEPKRKLDTTALLTGKD